MFCAILTLFPEACKAYLDESILGIAQEKGHLQVELVNFRDFTHSEDGFLLKASVNHILPQMLYQSAQGVSSVRGNRDGCHCGDVRSKRCDAPRIYLQILLRHQSYGQR